MRKMEISKTLVFICLFLFTFCGFAHANKIIYVDDDGPTDFNNIQAAINDANNGDTILVADGTYTGDGNRDIYFYGKALTLKSENGAETCIIDCQYHQGFYVRSQVNVLIIDGFTIMNGYASEGGGIFFHNSYPTEQNNFISKILNCKFVNNVATRSGGAIDSSNSIIQNCEFIGNRASVGGAISCSNTSIFNCVISGNISTSTSNYGGGAIFCQSANLIINNSTIVNNHSNSLGGGISIEDGNAKIRNSIITNNTAMQNEEIYLYQYTKSILLDISYSNIEGGLEGIVTNQNTILNWGAGNIDVNPLFANPGYWADANDPNIIAEPNDLNAIWIDGDYHLKSQAGRWNPNSQSWVQDDVTSPCIDAGDPNSPIGYEPFPNGGYINMGSYGGTVEASKSYFGKPVCETIVAGDINGDCKVDELDMAIMMIHWLEDYNPISVKVIDGVEFRIQTDKTFYKQGENVQMDFTVTNNTNETVHIGCSRSSEFYLIVQNDETTIWRSTDGWYWFSPGVELLAGESKGISRSWDMKNDYGSFWDPGTYHIVGIMFNEPWNNAREPENYYPTEVRTSITISAYASTQP